MGGPTPLQARELENRKAEDLSRELGPGRDDTLWLWLSALAMILFGFYCAYDIYQSSGLGNAILLALQLLIMSVPIMLVLAIALFRAVKGRLPDLPSWVYDWLRRGTPPSE